MHRNQFKLRTVLARCLFLLLALLLLSGRLHASDLVYTIQSGSFEDMELANMQFDTIAGSLQKSEIQHLRIERIEPYFCVRLGKFETFADALNVLEQLQPRQPLLYEAIVLEAYITDARIKRMFPDTGEKADHNEEPDKENETAPAEHAQQDEEPVVNETVPAENAQQDEEPVVEEVEEVVLPDPQEEKAEKEQEDVVKPVKAAVKPVKKASVPEKKDDGRISLSVQDADIRKVLKGLALKKDLNIVISQEVQGKVSVNVNNLKLHEVLDAIITINGFNYMKKDNIIFVTKSKDGEKETFFDAEVRMFRLQYADVDEAESVVKELVSEAANITLYKPEKIIVIEDELRNLNSIAKVLKALDVPPRQVLIETKILQVRLNDDTSLGIDWSNSFDDFFNSTGQVSTQGFTGASQGFFFNILNGDFSLFLDALNNITEVDTLSSPSLLALDNKEAKIIIGEKLGYYVTTATEATVLQSVEFLDTGTQLVLTPRIIDDESVIMEIHPEVSDGIVIDGLPSKNTAEVTTNLMAPNGGTIFIGGLLRDKKEDIKNRVPVLGKIPLLGALFSKTTNITSRTEIVVLITPHIISDENQDMLARSNERVTAVEEYLREERSDKELLPGTK